jgi:CDP-diacylglycerol---glycerol-3-phosphate 3-phosphatidyltransferase
MAEQLQIIPGCGITAVNARGRDGMSFANYLTFFRIFISPIFLLLYLERQALGISAVVLPYVLLALLAISELSDILDGFLARRYDQVTDLGKILDPMADSIYRISIFLTFTLPPVNLSMLLVFVFIYRDSVIGTLRTICALRGFALAARPSGKLKAIVQAVSAFAILGLMIPHSLGAISDWTLKIASTWIVAAAALYTVLSGIEYIYANRSYIRELLKSSKKSA